MWYDSSRNIGGWNVRLLNVSYRCRKRAGIKISKSINNPKDYIIAVVIMCVGVSVLGVFQFSFQFSLQV